MAEGLFNSIPGLALASQVAIGDKVITLNQAVGSSGTQFRLLIGTEILIVNSGGGTAILNVTRGAEGTQANSYSQGQPVKISATAGGLTAYIQQQPLSSGVQSVTAGANVTVTGTGANPTINVPSIGPTTWFDATKYGVVGDGVTDTTAAINTFLSVTLSAGGVAFFPAGTYLYSTDLLPVSNTTIQGVGESTIFMAKSGATNVANGFNLNNISGVRLLDFVINGNKANINQSGAGATYTTKQGVYVTGGSHDILARGLLIHDTFAGGILFDNASKLLIQDNRFLNCGDNAVFGRPSPVAQSYAAPSNFVVVGNKVSGGSYSGIGIIKATDFTVTGNVSYSNGPTLGQGSGIVIEGATNFAVAGNQCHDNGVNGIDIRYSNEGDGTNVASSHGTVSGNQTYNNGFGSGYGNAGGYVTEGANDVLFEGNSSYHDEFGLNYGSGNSLDPTNITSQGNRANACNVTGVKFFTGSASVNLVSDGDVVLASGSDGFTANCKVTIMNPYFTGPTGTGKENIHFLSGSSSSRVLGGTLRDPIDNCILIDSTVTDIRVRGTVINKGSGTGGRALFESNTSGAGAVIEQCEITGFTFQSFSFGNTASLARNNTIDQSGFYDHNSGSASISAATSVVVTHNLWTTPTRVEVTPTGDPGSGIRWWVSAKGATTFTITVSASTTVTFDWRAYTWDL